MIKARRDTAVATGHAHINITYFLSHCTTMITVFALLFRIVEGIDVNKTQSIHLFLKVEVLSDWNGAILSLVFHIYILSNPIT